MRLTYYRPQERVTWDTGLVEACDPLEVLKMASAEHCGARIWLGLTYNANIRGVEPLTQQVALQGLARTLRTLMHTPGVPTQVFEACRGLLPHYRNLL